MIWEFPCTFPPSISVHFESTSWFLWARGCSQRLEYLLKNLQGSVHSQGLPECLGPRGSNGGHLETVKGDAVNTDRQPLWPSHPPGSNCIHTRPSFPLPLDLGLKVVK